MDTAPFSSQCLTFLVQNTTSPHPPCTPVRPTVELICSLPHLVFIEAEQGCLMDNSGFLHINTMGYWMILLAHKSATYGQFVQTMKKLG